MTAIGWDEPTTAMLYESFCDRHSRYQEANRALAEHAVLKPGLRVLDLAAGTGRTAEVVLPFLGPDDRIVAVEPAAAMRSVGAKRLGDSRVRWTEALPDEPNGFARIVCGAAIWQLIPLDRTIAALARLLEPGGALVFNIPALYLGIPDPPGEGRDPYLLELPARLTDGIDPPAIAGEALPNADGIDALLETAGLFGERWTVSARLTQAAYRDWLKVPPMTNGWLAALSAEERARRIDRAFATVDADSWRWETWLGWTAWKR